MLRRTEQNQINSIKPYYLLFIYIIILLSLLLFISNLIRLNNKMHKMIILLAHMNTNNTYLIIVCF